MKAKDKETASLPESKPIDQSRRSFAKTGVVAPIILSFTSKPSWGQIVGDCSPNTAMSITHGSHHPNDPVCTPQSPSTVSPGVFQGAHIGSDGWTEHGVGGYKKYLFNSVFASGPRISIQEDSEDSEDNHSKETKDSSSIGHMNSEPTLEEVIKANPKNLRGADKAQVNHYVTAFLSSVSPTLVFPYTASQIADDWGKWQLYGKLQDLQSNHLTIEDALRITNGAS